jgi:hypothetical protein
MKEYIERESLIKDCDATISNIQFTSPYQDDIDTMVSGMERIRDMIDEAPAADVIEKEKYDHLLKIARKMHTWIFLNTGDEQAAYDQMGLTDEDNVLLGYGGQIELEVRGNA